MPDLRSPFADGFDADDATVLAATLKALANPTRVRIVSLIHHAGQMSDVDLEPHLGVEQSTVSHHVRILAEAGLVETSRNGVFKPRHLVYDALTAVAAVLRLGGGR